MRISDRIKQREKERAKSKALAAPSSDAVTDIAQVSDEDSAPSLTPQDRALIRAFTVKGGSAFDEIGWGPAKVADFFARPPVQREIQRLAYLIENGEAVLGRQMFLARVELGETVPECLTIVRRALRGQLPDAQGRVLPVSSLPDPAQVDLAMQLLQTCGIDKGMLKQLTATNVLDVELTQKRSTKDDGQYQMAQVLQRERSRDALEKLTSIIRSTDAKVEQLEGKRDLAQERKSKRRAKRKADPGVE